MTQKRVASSKYYPIGATCGLSRRRGQVWLRGACRERGSDHQSPVLPSVARFSTQRYS